MYKAAKRVCVIGAGPSGMSAVYQFKQLEMKGQEIPEIVCFDKQSDWGGLWKYSWQTGEKLVVVLFFSFCFQNPDNETDNSTLLLVTWTSIKPFVVKSSGRGIM